MTRHLANDQNMHGRPSPTTDTPALRRRSRQQQQAPRGVKAHEAVSLETLYRLKLEPAPPSMHADRVFLPSIPSCSRLESRSFYCFSMHGRPSPTTDTPALRRRSRQQQQAPRGVKAHEAVSLETLYRLKLEPAPPSMHADSDSRLEFSFRQFQVYHGFASTPCRHRVLA